MADKKKKTPADIIPVVQQMHEKLKDIRRVEAGWPEVAEFLQQFSTEDPDDFRIRKMQRCWTDFFNPTVEAIVGRIFGDNLTFNGGDRANELWQDIDNRGTAGEVFIKRLSQDAVAAGQSFILVDYPMVDGELTRGQRRELNLRPYFVSIPLDNITNFHADIENGVTRLKLFAYKEVVEVRDGFDVEYIDRYRVYRRDGDLITVEIWQKAGDKEEVVLVEGPIQIIGQTDIPITSINLKPVDYLVSEPPLEELANQSIDYYRITSDMLNAHHLTSYPTFVTTGRLERDKDGKPISLGPGHRLHLSDPTAKAEFVAGDGKGVELGKELLELKRSEMGITGLSHLETDTRMAETATAKALDNRVDDEKINLYIKEIEDSVNVALEYLALYEDIPAPTISLEEVEAVDIQPEIEVEEEVTEPQSMTA